MKKVRSCCGERMIIVLNGYYSSKKQTMATVAEEVAPVLAPVLDVLKS